MEAILEVIRDRVSFVEAKPASVDDIAACHTSAHIAHIRRSASTRSPHWPRAAPFRPPKSA
jgi:hypothetical protein